MIALKLIEQTVTSIKSVYTSNTGIDNLFVFNALDSARETVLNKRSAAGDKTVPSQLLQYIDLYYDASIQPYNTDGSYTVYPLPRLSQISSSITAPVTVMKMKGVSYILYTSLQQYETMSRRSELANKECVVLVNNSAGDQIRLYGERKNHLRAQAILASPMQLETFNPYFDEFPATGTMYSAMELEIANLYMKNLQSQAPRYIKESGVK